MLIYIFLSIYMYCLVFVTVCKIKIPHKGCYFTFGNIVMKTNLFFSCRSVDETNENIHTSCNTHTKLENIKLYFFYLMAAISNENIVKVSFSININPLKPIIIIVQDLCGPN